MLVINYFSPYYQSRQYRDFIADLPEVISLKILSYVEGKDIMRSATVRRMTTNGWME